MFFSFEKNKKKVDVAPFVRRLIDLTVPNRPIGDDARSDLRYNRTFPVLLQPWRRKKAITSETQIAFSRDFSDRGVGLISLTEPTDENYVITVWPNHEEFEHPYYFVAAVRDFRPLSLGLWLVGFELQDILTSDQPELLAVAQKSLRTISQEVVGIS